MSKRAVINSSPLIFLAKADLLELLKLAGDEIVVPLAVANEIKSYGPSDPAVMALDKIDWLIIVETPTIPLEIEVWSLGAGESAVLAWAYLNAGTEAIIDDLAGRRCAATLGIAVRGTLGLVLAAKKQGRIGAARPVIEKLLLAGMYLSDKVINQALALVGE